MTAELTPTESRMLGLLTDTPQPPGHLGTMLWPKKSRPPQAYARPAGKILNKLKKLELAAWVLRDGAWGWVRDRAGKRNT